MSNLRNKHGAVSILVTGHSLGGALATFAGVELQKRFTNVILYTFGSPRTGDQGWTDYAMRTVQGYQRVTHYNDIVPHLPMVIQGFNHAGTEVWYLHEGTDTAFTIC